MSSIATRRTTKSVIEREGGRRWRTIKIDT